MRLRWLVIGVLAAAVLPALAQEQPVLGDLPTGEWSQIKVPEAKCLYGDDYSFFVRPAGSPTDDLMIYFEGGGACWNGLTCAAKGQYASEYDVSDNEASLVGGGLLDFSNAENPVRDYNAVFIPYCSGDIHTGSKDAVTLPVPAEAATPGSTDTEVTVNFNGYTLATDALDWVYDNYTAPAQVLVTGCSAGGYGAINHAANIMQNYLDTRVVMLADASTGVTPTAWEGLTTWGTLSNMPAFIPSLANVTPEQYNATFHIKEMARYFPNNTFAEYNTFLDQVQIGFYGIMTGRNVDVTNFVAVGTEWAKELLENIATLDVTTPNFYSYMPGGTVHCITPRAETYTYTVQGIRFIDWVQSLLDGKQMKNAACDVSTGECNMPPSN